MPNKVNYQVVQIGIKDTSEAPRGKDIFYQCVQCNGIISSVPKNNIDCECGNISIDVDYFRFYVRDYSKIQVLKKLST